METPVYLVEAQAQIQQDLATALSSFSVPEPLKSAVHHAVMLGGKRIRPALCYATSLLKNDKLSAEVRRAAVAVELIHCYSLVHDDLPCMDDDELRRGLPTCHVKYDQPTALLAGDILQSMAMEVLSSRLFADDGHESNSQIVLKQMQILATASSKMVCGQMLDLQAEQKIISQTELEEIHQNKTGALIIASIMLGAVTVFSPSDSALSSLRLFGQKLGLAYQVQDDVLDIEGDTKTLGKTAGKDVQAGKSTYPALMGLAQARDYAEQLYAEALQALEHFTERNDALKQLTEYLSKRKH